MTVRKIDPGKDSHSRLLSASDKVYEIQGHSFKYIYVLFFFVLRSSLSQGDLTAFQFIMSNLVTCPTIWIERKFSFCLVNKPVFYDHVFEIVLSSQLTRSKMFTKLLCDKEKNAEMVGCWVVDVGNQDQSGEFQNLLITFPVMHDKAM